MSTATASPAAASAATTAHRAKFDQRWVAPILITCILLVANWTFGVLESPYKTLLAIAVSIATEAIASRVFFKKWPHLASAYVTGISVGILVRSPFFWPYAVCSAISILSKYVLRTSDQHIWNPSNFGIVWLLFLAPQAVAPLGIQWSNSVVPMVIIWILGSFIISRLKRFHICATYVVSFLVLAVLRCALTHQPVLAEIAPITGPMYQLFIFFMITDPKTTVRTKKGQILVTVLIALVEAVLRLFHFIDAPFYALFLVGPAANIIELRKIRRQKAAAARAAAAA